MAVTVRIPTPLRPLTDGEAAVRVEAAQVGQAIKALETRFPGLTGRLRDRSGARRRFVNLFVNTEDIRFLQDLATPLKDGDELSIVPAISGG